MVTVPEFDRMISFGPPPFSFPSPEIEPGRRETVISENCEITASVSGSTPDTLTSTSAR
jgi:hypothetical protein